jgi:hypothetical protein
VLQTTLFLLVQQEVPLLFTHQTLGFVVPGLIAYQLIRQPIRATAAATGIVVGATYVTMISGILTGLVPSV